MALQFTKATKRALKLRLAITGPTGSGKTYSALAIATGLGDTIAVLDTEHASASLYADEFSFDTIKLTDYHPKYYIEGIKAAEAGGYETLIIDSLSHAWMGKGGILEQLDNKKQRGGNGFTAWGELTPIQNELIDTILAARLHIIATMRSEMDYVIEQNEKGKSAPQKIGLAPVQRKGVEYEFTIVGDMDLKHTMFISKSRCKELDGEYIKRPGAEIAKTLLNWLNKGEADDLAQKETQSGQPPISTPAATAIPPATRPYTPVQLKEKLQQGVDKKLAADVTMKKPIEAKLLQKVQANFGNLIGADEAKRHELIEYLFGVKSSKQLNMAQGETLINWIGAKEVDGRWTPNVESAIEVDKIFAQLAAELAEKQSQPMPDGFDVNGIWRGEGPDPSIKQPERELQEEF